VSRTASTGALTNSSSSSSPSLCRENGRRLFLCLRHRLRDTSQYTMLVIPSLCWCRSTEAYYSEAIGPLSQA
jgi:hypothetical protein